MTSYSKSRKYYNIFGAVVIGSNIGYGLLTSVKADWIREYIYQLYDHNEKRVELSESTDKKLYKLLIDKLKWSVKKIEKVDFFLTNTLDYDHIGFLPFALVGRHDAYCGLPLTFEANNIMDLEKLPKNDLKFMFQNIDLKNMSENLKQSLILSEDAKQFAVTRELISLNRPTQAYRTLFDVSIMTTIFYMIYGNTFLKRPIYLFRSKYLTYLSIGVLTVLSMVKFHQFDNINAEKYADERACELGLDLCEGAIEYYQKLRQRNLALRNIISNGTEIIDKDGNIKNIVVKVPFIDSVVKIEKFSQNLKDREEFCKAKMICLIDKLNKEATEPKIEPESKKVEEWEFFKQIRLNFDKSKKTFSD